MKNYNFETVAELAKLSFDSNEKESFERDFVDMISFADMLFVEEVNEEENGGICPLCDDIPHESSCFKSALLSNAPELSGDYISVPRII